MDVEALRETTATKVTDRPRKAGDNWLLQGLDGADEQEFVAMTALAEYLFNEHYPVEGVFLYLPSLTNWECIMLLECGYVHDLCVKFEIAFPSSYPDQPPRVRVAAPAVLIHPLVNEESGEVDVLQLLDGAAWNPVSHCTVHLLAGLKMMLLDPCRQPFALSAADASSVPNGRALREFLSDPGVPMTWRSVLIESLRIKGDKSPRSTLEQDLDIYINNLNTGGFLQDRLTDPQLVQMLNRIDSILQSHVDIMVHRIQSNHNVSLLKLVMERVGVIHEDLLALVTPPPVQD